MQHDVRSIPQPEATRANLERYAAHAAGLAESSLTIRQIADQASAVINQSPSLFDAVLELWMEDPERWDGLA